MIEIQDRAAIFPSLIMHVSHIHVIVQAIANGEAVNCADLCVSLSCQKADD